MKRDLYVKKGGAAVPTGVSAGDAILQTANAQAVAQLQQAVATLQASNTQLAADLAAEKAKGKAPNTEVWITESGTWTAPVTGWCDVLLIAGGSSGCLNKNNWQLAGGYGGARLSALVFLTAGDAVPVVIGAGGTPSAGMVDQYLMGNGGHTSFGSLTTEGEKIEYQLDVRTAFSQKPAVHALYGVGQGPGGGYPTAPLPENTQDQNNRACDGRSFGGGAAVIYDLTANRYAIGNGTAGAIRLRYYDPNKTTTPDTDQEQTSPQNPSGGA